jgi:hypothetical protein
MHEIRAAIPADAVDEVIRIARTVGVSEVTTSEVLVRGPNVKRVLCSVETSTPQARALTQALMSAPSLKDIDISLTSRELRAIVSKTPAKLLTKPMSEPYPDVVQDLWQLSHVTPSYYGRGLAGAILMASGIIDNNPIPIVVAALFLPFLAQVLACGIGLWDRDKELVLHGLKAVGVSIALAFLGGAVVAAFEGGPVGFHGFKGPLSSLAISSVIGVTAGLSSADDAGRRYLIGVAAAVQLAIFPVWMGVVTVTGIPDRVILVHHLLSFSINLVTIAVSSVVAYAFVQPRSSRGVNPERHASIGN